jgi:hypothetical protein
MSLPPTVPVIVCLFVADLNKFTYCHISAYNKFETPIFLAFTSIALVSLRDIVKRAGTMAGECNGDVYRLVKKRS